MESGRFEEDFRRQISLDENVSNTRDRRGKKVLGQYNDTQNEEFGEPSRSNLISSNELKDDMLSYDQKNNNTERFEDFSGDRGNVERSFSQIEEPLEDGQPSYITRSFVRETRTERYPKPQPVIDDSSSTSSSSSSSSSSSESVYLVPQEPSKVIYLYSNDHPVTTGASHCPCMSSLKVKQKVHDKHYHSKHHRQGKKHHGKHASISRRNKSVNADGSLLGSSSQRLNSNSLLDRPSFDQNNMNDDRMLAGDYNDKTTSRSSYDYGHREPLISNRRTSGRTTLRNTEDQGRKRSFFSRMKSKFS